MKTPILVSIALFLGGSHDLSIKHENGQVRRTSYTFEDERSLAEMTSTVDGEERGGMDDMQHHETYGFSGVFVDRTVESADSKRTVFDREYEELSLNMSIEITPPFGEGTNEEASGESELEGATVRFTWDADDEDFASAFAEGEDGDDDLLEGLTAEFPWASYLPEEGVEADAEWNIAPEVLIQTMELGGDMSLTNDQEGLIETNHEKIFLVKSKVLLKDDFRLKLDELLSSVNSADPEKMKFLLIQLASKSL